MRNRNSKTLLIILFIFFAGWSSFLFSQISEDGTPPSFRYAKTVQNAISATKTPIDFYVEDLRATDDWRASMGFPKPIGKLIPVDYSMENSGSFTQLPGGETVWRFHLICKDAVAVMLYYNDFYIPEGGLLYIYSPDRTQLLGAYTHQTRPSGGRYTTSFIGGEELILEYVSSNTSAEKPRLSIGDIGYGYNRSALREFFNVTTRASESCEVNVNCEEGEAWQNEKNSVCRMITRGEKWNYYCTGSLMNNTAEDFKPLILSALHCGYDSEYKVFAAEQYLEQWEFQFNRERIECSNSSPSKPFYSMVGCQLLAATGLERGSEGMLLLLNDPIPDNYPVFYNGWDVRGIAAASGVGIHHPNGDYKKISTFDETAKSFTFITTGFTCETNAHWNVLFKATSNGHGVTEGGSSGSPLYNENKLVIGTLSGGTSDCSFPRGWNVYGKMSYHWDRYKTDASTRMDVWLDPLNTGVKTLSGRFRKELKPPPTNLKAVNMGNSISLTWSAPISVEKPKFYTIYRKNTKISETAALGYVDKTVLEGSVTYAVSAVYGNDEESAFATVTLLLSKYKAPSDLKATRQNASSTQIDLSWKPPMYEQTIYWGTLLPTYIIGFDERTPFYFGQQWTAEEIKPLNKKTITAIQFFPIDKNVYEIYIKQGDQTYRQPIAAASLKPMTLNTIDLNTPFVIDGTKTLIVSIYISKVGTDYPAVCDNGPAIDGKGNICSGDGLEWFRLNEDEDPDEFDYNFVITAIVSSEKGATVIQKKSFEYQKSFEHQKFLEHQKSFEHPPCPPSKGELGVRLKGELGVLAKGESLEEQPLVLRSSEPAAFPEITKYRVYRSGSFYKDVPAPETSVTDIFIINSVYYEVSAIYDIIESEKSEKVSITLVGIERVATDGVTIVPIPFTDIVTVQGHEQVSRIDVISVSGQVCLSVNHPPQQLNTSSLAPGLYFFRICDIHNNQKVIKAIK